MSNLPAEIDFNDRSVIDTLKRTVAKGATDEEFAMFAEHCRSSGLNPFKREVWFIKTHSAPQIMTGIGGFFTIANRHPQFDGLESGLIGPDGGLASQTYPKNDYIGAWCRVHRKDRKVPFEEAAMRSEYEKTGGTWKTMPRIMIIKCAQSLALRKAFSQECSGLYTVEEMGQAQPKEPVDVTPPKAEPPKGIKTSYYVPDVKDAQVEFFEAKGCLYSPEKGLWECPENLGPKLEKYKVEEDKPLDKVFGDDDVMF